MSNNKSDIQSINLRHLLNFFGEERTEKFLSDFECKLNIDIENFLKKTAIGFSKQRLGMTHLVFKRLQKDNPDSGWAVVGFYSIAAKTIKLNKNTKLSSRMKKRVEKFSDAENDEDYYTFSAPLIGQLGKNYKDGLNRLASGKELLDLALDTIVAAQNEIGGKLTYLECEDNEKLISFYTNNGFAVFNKKINIDNKTGEKYCLVQLIKYMSE